ncbi:MAG: TlyA family RNA methyltransferase [Clostridia bacterium]|nr:TlyA family RNA methyltransferase [Clostridia bacterium]
MRLDVYLTENGFADSRQRAKVMIAGGCVTLNGKPASKPSAEVREGDLIEVSGDPIGYVSRGALKLKAAFEAFALSADGKIAADIGASTGGFTEYLLEQGAARVYAVDAGTDQLAAKLRADVRVVSMEKYNARNLVLNDFDGGVDLAAMDVSFISQTLILPALVGILKEQAFFVSLIKPQFEAGRDAIGKGGIVKNSVSRAMAIKKVIDCAAVNGLSFCGLAVSPILGGDGNTEYLACFSKGGAIAPFDGNVDLLISKMVNKR